MIVILIFLANKDLLSLPFSQCCKFTIEWTVDVYPVLSVQLYLPSIDRYRKYAKRLVTPVSHLTTFLLVICNIENMKEKLEPSISQRILICSHCYACT
jgi:hypothetical protein